MTDKLIRSCAVLDCSNIFADGEQGKLIYVRSSPADPGHQVEICSPCYRRILNSDEPAKFKAEVKT